jgi:hypothetical protein
MWNRLGFVGRVRKKTAALTTRMKEIENTWQGPEGSNEGMAIYSLPDMKIVNFNIAIGIYLIIN